MIGYKYKKQVNAMELSWIDGFEIRVRREGGGTVISANRAGLLSLASQLAALAEQAPGSHIHYDAYNALEDGSAELIVEHLQPGDRACFL